MIFAGVARKVLTPVMNLLPSSKNPKTPYGRNPKVGNPIASILKSNAHEIPALFVLNPVSNFLGFAIRDLS